MDLNVKKLIYDTWSNRLAWGLVLLYSVTFTWLAVQRHLSFQSGFDLGVYNQVVWNTLHGRIFFYTSTGEPLLHLAHHADPILLLPAPLYLIHAGPETLLLLQATLIGLAGLPLFWLGRERLNSNLAGLALLGAYLLFPPLQAVTLSDFHPPAMAFAFLMFAFYFLEKEKPGPFLLFVVLAMACKEQIPLQVVFLGLYALLWKKERRLGLFTIFLGLTWFVVVMYWVIPAFSVTGNHIFLDYYAAFGDSPARIVLTVLTRPDLVVQTLLQPDRLAYLWQVFAPFAFLPLLGLPALLVGAPSFAINLLSANPAMHTATRGHYVADVTPWLVWGTLFGLVYLVRAVTRFRPAWRRGTTVTLSLSLLVVALTWQLFHGFTPLAVDAPRWEVTPHDRRGHQLLAQIPPHAPISAQLRLYAHLSGRKIAYVFPHIFEAEYIFLDVTADTSPLHPYDQRYEVADLLQSGIFGVREGRDGYLILERGLDAPTLPHAFYDFARVPGEVQPQFPLSAQFGEDLRLLGFDLFDDARSAETRVRLYWQALGPIDDDLRLYPFFIDPQGAVIETTALRPMATQIWYPPRMWQPGEIIVSETRPWPLGERWSLAVGVLAGEDWSQWDQRLKVTALDATGGARRFETNSWVRLASFERQGRELVRVLPDDADLTPSRPLAANLGDKIQLLGYDLAQTEDSLELTLYWQALEPMGYDYTVFVHLVDEQGNIVAQRDAQPEWELPLPTSTWQPGETLRDRHPLPLPADLPPGTYHLRIGVYYWQTLERLPVRQDSAPSGDVVALGEVAIR